ncbi:hypothetical protein [Marinomonas mediterranea]|uniref:hypothetical protein n=1 Tax=Marinomonas mediterranea TaxID=119864 RepID=UPI00234BF85D|nr:hypothetical protein [Marinomonas mediterranea]WCN07866.1 hypothetical protein GV055_02450 [Marinomonas mediterranea]
MKRTLFLFWALLPHSRNSVMSDRAVIVIFASLIVMSFLSNRAFALEAEGRALDPKTKVLLYTERHFFPAPQVHEVRYFEADGRLFATKKLDYAQSSNAPSFEQLNERQGEAISVKHTDKIELQYRASSDAATKSATFNVSNKLVIDAGFDRYVREHWSELVNRKTHSVDYLVPSRQTTVEFKIKRRTCLDEQISESVCFEVKPSAWWLSLLINPLYLAYDETTKRLVRFIGRGNIADKNGKYQTVDIYYQYIE